MGGWIEGEGLTDRMTPEKGLQYQINLEVVVVHHPRRRQTQTKSWAASSLIAIPPQSTQKGHDE